MHAAEQNVALNYARARSIAPSGARLSTFKLASSPPATPVGLLRAAYMSLGWSPWAGGCPPRRGRFSPAGRNLGWLDGPFELPMSAGDARVGGMTSDPSGLSLNVFAFGSARLLRLPAGFIKNWSAGSTGSGLRTVVACCAHVFRHSSAGARPGMR